MMSKFTLKNFNLRHMVVAISALTFSALTLLVAFFSSLVAFNEMNSGLYHQGVQLSLSLAKDSVAPLLFDSPEGAKSTLNLLKDIEQVTEVRIVSISDKVLITHRASEHVKQPYPEATLNNPFSEIETPDGWSFSALVTTKQAASDSPGDILELEQEFASEALGYVNLTVSKAGIINSRLTIFVRNSVISSTVAILLLLIMYALLRNLTQPLEKLSQLMEQGQRGEYQIRSNIHGTKEITEISRTFNEMIYAIGEREQNLSLTLDSIGDAVIATDAEGLITRMNPVAENLTGWTLEEAKNQPAKSIFPIIDATTRKPIKSPVEKVLATGKTVYLSNHTTLISRDGTEYQIADSAAPIRDENGHILGMVLVFNDVTEQYQLRQAAAKNKRDLQAVMDNSPAVIYVKDTQGCFTFINRQFEILYHVKRDAILGRTPHEVFTKDIAHVILVNDEAVLLAGHALESEETVSHDDGLHTYISIKFPLFDDDGNTYAVCGISTDITERRKQEEQLRRSQKMDALGKLTGGVAHDYNNMLGIVMGYADILETELCDQPKLANYAEKICHAGERGTKLTKKLLAFSKQQSSDVKKLNLNTMLLDEKDMLERVLTARIKLKFDLAEDLWPVCLDSGDLEDATVNLCINAMHAIKGNGKLTIRTRKRAVNSTEARALQLTRGDYVQLSITDTGCGMDEAIKEKIFEPFFTTKGEKGTGLGLAQVYGFVERSRGAIQVYSELDHGTQFALYFPRHYEIDNNEVPEEKNSNVDFRGNETILVVDDEPELLDLVSEILCSQGYTVICAKNGEQALEILEHKPVDLMLSDIIMPEMDGYELAATIKEKYPHIKIQLTSGFSDERHINMVDSSLHKHLLHKPYHSKALLKRIRELLSEK